MSSPYYQRYSISSVLLLHVGISIVLIFVFFPLSIAGLYTWAKTKGTCEKRSPYTLLSLLETLLPVVTRPIQQLICPH